MEEAKPLKVTNAQGVMTLIALCLCTFCNAYLLISPFPYGGFMAMHLVPGLTSETTGFYAGLLSSSFMIGRACSSYSWGHFADKYGRQTALNLSLFMSFIFSILFGMSSSFSWAVVSRFFLGKSLNNLDLIAASFLFTIYFLRKGATSCIMVIVKTYATELANGDSKFETKAMGLTVGMRGWGFLVSPGISGYLSDPIKQYPNWRFQISLLREYPYLLPNIVGALISLLSFGMAWLYLPETLPSYKRQSLWSDLTHVRLNSQKIRHQNDASEEEKLISGSHVNVRNKESYNSVDKRIAISEQSREELSEQRVNIWAIRDTRNALLCYWMWSMVVICLDEMFPLFCLSKEGGLGWTEATIGQILSASGIPFVFAQYCVFTWFMEKVGMYLSLCIMSLLGIPPTALIPVALLWHTQGTRASTIDYIFLCGLLAICRVFASSYFAAITLVLNRSVTPEYRGKLQGLSMGGASLFKGVGPTFAGLLYSICVSSTYFSPHLGSFLAFQILALLGLGVCVTTFLVMKPLADT